MALVQTQWLAITTANLFPVELHNFCAAVAPQPAAWPTASLAMYVPLYITVNTVIQRVAWVNGATVSGNVDFGIYNEAGTALFRIGGVAQSGVSLLQSASVGGTGLLLIPGRYWMGFVFDNTTATAYRWTNAAGAANSQKMIGMMQQAAAYPLPATMTLAASVNAFIPDIGVYLSTLAI